MFNKELFDTEFAKTGLKKKFVCENLSMAYDHFVKLTNGDTEWRTGEVDAICKFLKWNKRMRDAIFFAQTVNREFTKV